MSNARQVDVDFVRKLQNEMLRSVPDWWEDEDRSHLRTLIRLTVEFFHYVQIESDDNELRYLGDSIFSGTESLGLVAMTCRMSGIDIASAFREATISAAAVKEEFIPRFQKFLGEVNFDERCKLLLDLYRLQIVFAGLTYS